MKKLNLIQVMNCENLKNNKWEITYKDLGTQKQTSLIFDALVVCNGHHHEQISKIPRKFRATSYTLTNIKGCTF